MPEELVLRFFCAGGRIYNPFGKTNAWNWSETSVEVEVAERSF